jgi:hypothetical protein
MDCPVRWILSPRVALSTTSGCDCLAFQRCTCVNPLRRGDGGAAYPPPMSCHACRSRIAGSFGGRSVADPVRAAAAPSSSSEQIDSGRGRPVDDPIVTIHRSAVPPLRRPLGRREFKPESWWSAIAHFDRLAATDARTASTRSHHHCPAYVLSHEKGESYAETRCRPR